MEPNVVDRETWLAARKALLEKEKAHSRAGDALAAEVRALPQVEVEVDYRFTAPEGEVGLRDLFDGRSQLLVYHFMFDPAWTAGCKSCSFITDHLQGALPHLHACDVTPVVVSRAPLPQLLAFRERMGWKHRWVSSHGSPFNYDFHVSFTQGQAGTYNFRPGNWSGSEAPGMSAFVLRDGRVFHTYSVYSRGLDKFIGAYTWLDAMPKGRDEEALDYGMAWVRLHDEY